MATQRRTDARQQDAEAMAGSSQGTKGAPEVEDDYFSSETSAAQPDSDMPQSKGETGQALKGADPEATDARAAGSAQQGAASEIQKTEK